MSKFGQYVKQESGNRVQSEQSKAPELSKVANIQPDADVTMTEKPIPTNPGDNRTEPHVPYR